MSEIKIILYFVFDIIKLFGFQMGWYFMKGNNEWCFENIIGFWNFWYSQSK